MAVRQGTLAQCNWRVTLDLLIADRPPVRAFERHLVLVTTGPDAAGIANRDTGVVVRDLFTTVRESGLLAGYAIFHGQRVFQALADRMLSMPSLKVRLFLDIQRRPGDTSASDRADYPVRRTIPITPVA